MPALTNKQSEIILDTELFSPYQTLILMVSGGSDSVALLRQVLELQSREDITAQIVVFHFNHQLRGVDSDSDEQFVRDLCAELEVECVVHSADVKLYAKQHRLSVEAAARTLRYEAVQEYVQSQNWGQTPISAPPAIVTAHTADDQTETFFMRSITGAGSKALSSMASAIDTQGSQKRRASLLIPSIRGPRASESCGALAGASAGTTLIRPLLSCDKADLQDYLKSVNQTWREDMTNFDNSSTRSLIRNELIPIIKQINPSINRTISKNCTILRDEADFLEDYSRQQITNYTLRVVLDDESTAVILFKESFYAGLALAVRRTIAKLVLEDMKLNNTDLSFDVIEKIADRNNSPKPAYTFADNLLFCQHGDYTMLVDTCLLSTNWTSICKELQSITGLSELPECLQKLRRRQ